MVKFDSRPEETGLLSGTGNSSVPLVPNSNYEFTHSFKTPVMQSRDQNFLL